MPHDYPTRTPTPHFMEIPDTPEQLFDQIAEPSLRELFPTFDTLRPFNQKLVRLLHTELIKGELSDATFQDSLIFVVMLWRSFNAGAMVRNDTQLEMELDIDETWIQAATAFHRIDQYLSGVLGILETMPPRTTVPPASPVGASTAYAHSSSDCPMRLPRAQPLSPSRRPF